MEAQRKRQDEETKNGFKSAVDQVKSLVERLQDVSMDNPHTVRQDFTTLKVAIEGLSEYLEDDVEDEELEEVALNVAAQANKILRRLAAEMRVHTG